MSPAAHGAVPTHLDDDLPRRSVGSMDAWWAQVIEHLLLWGQPQIEAVLTQEPGLAA